MIVGRFMLRLGIRANVVYYLNAWVLTGKGYCDANPVKDSKYFHKRKTREKAAE